MTYLIKFLNRRSYRSAHVLLNLLNKLGKRSNVRLAEHLISFSQRVKKFNNTRARILNSIYHDIKNTLKSQFWHKKTL